MIFRIIEDATGAVAMSVDAPDAYRASLYLKPGQTLMASDGPLVIADCLEVASDGTLQRSADAPDLDLPFAGEGLALTPVLTEI
ncbi:hypothetical protein GCM10017620_24560 [Brevundimonas intermedia]|uniref:Uncharacterized protein n=1 Tax=Brevundimonas intermedia TaxID=74315 RepID=A0ABQ5TDZ1_9CAUL|nr:hypothetical protein [Brevundimonas intermedia]GLK49483.1 hypothetical protein GCM10017620_24560 [Brevundimonas intermedia]